MSESEASEVPAPETEAQEPVVVREQSEPAPAPVTLQMKQLFELGQGLDWICWGIPISLFLIVLNQAYEAILPGYVVGIIMVFWGVKQVHVNVRETPWRKYSLVALLTAFLLIYFTPFLFWWKYQPQSVYFVVHAICFGLSLIALLAALNRFAAAVARSFRQYGFYVEAKLCALATVILLGVPLTFLVYEGVRFSLRHNSTPYAQLASTLQELHWVLGGMLTMLVLLPFTMTVVNLWRCRRLCLDQLD